jgi:hypothetical protein
LLASAPAGFVIGRGATPPPARSNACANPMIAESSMRTCTLAVLLAVGVAAPALAQSAAPTSVGGSKGQQGAGDPSTSGSMAGGSGGAAGMHADPVSPGGVGSGLSTNTQPPGSGGAGASGGGTSGGAPAGGGGAAR